jgi:hypothetical protein
MAPKRIEGEEHLEPLGFVPLGPQSIGPTETIFAGKIKDELQADPSVLRAYLALCSFNRAEPEVALCLAFAPDCENFDIIQGCRGVFVGMFSKVVSLAIFPLSDNQETELRRVGVEPFFSRPGHIT